MNTLNSYRRYKGKVTTANEKGSPEGVMIAARTTTARIACLRYSFIHSFFKMPRLDKTTTNVGNSKTIPNVNTIEVSKEMYEERENMFGTAALT